MTIFEALHALQDYYKPSVIVLQALCNISVRLQEDSKKALLKTKIVVKKIRDEY